MMLLASHRLASAERDPVRGFVEVIGGVAIPVADEDYKKRLDNSPKVGARAGLAVNTIAGLEIGLDYSPLREKPRFYGPPIETVDTQRIRFLAGGRIIKRRGPQHAFARITGGIEVV
jgi:hypothetical protein